MTGRPLRLSFRRMVPEAITAQYQDVVVLAAVMALLVNVFFLFRIVPWRTPGSWNRIWLLATLAAVFFLVAEAAILPDRSVTAVDNVHQVPLFGVLLAGAAAFFLVYRDGFRAAERSRILSLTDQLTGLPNRRAFEERLRVAFERRERFALIYVDLDGFKQVNDTSGHDVGDEALRQVGVVLRDCVRQADMAARVGGDEFCLLLTSTAGDSSLVVADRVLAGLAEIPLPRGMRLGASFGIATERQGATPRDVVAAADAAMYRAKREGGRRVAFAPTPSVAATGTGA